MPGPEILLIGILLGLASAFASSMAYLASRRFTVRHAGHEPSERQWRGPLRLMVCSHVVLSVVCGVAFLVLLPRGADSQPSNLGWAMLTSVFVALFYLTGNTLVFFALRRSEASRIAPLLGFKVVILALVTQFVLKEPLLNTQWGAVVLAAGAAWVLGASGGRLPWATVALTIGSCSGFVCSDVFISRMVPAWLPEGVDYEWAKLHDPALVVRASMTGMSLVYVWCGIIAIALLPIAKPRKKEHWQGSVSYAGAWLTAMVCLFSCFALTNIVLGNILQATRGLMSILIGIVIAKLGHHHIESHVPLKIIIQRCIAAAFMIGAITLYITAKK